MKRFDVNSNTGNLATDKVNKDDLTRKKGKDKNTKTVRKIPEHITSIDQLFGTLPNDIDLDDVKAERLAK